MRSNRINLLKKILWMSVVVPMFLAPSLFGAVTVKIMPLGDSITHGADTFSQADNSSIAYRGPLWTKLSESGYTVDFVGSQTAGSDYQVTDASFDLNHEGYDGYHADQIDSGVTGYLTANPADVVLLHIGTNDLVAGEPDTVGEVESILDKIKVHNSNPKVIIARIINRETYDADTTTFNNDLNTMVQNRITNGDDIVIVDMENDAGINYATDMVDNLHPDSTGYDRMADLWYSALQTVIPAHVWTLDETAGSPYVDDYRGADGTCAGEACPVPDGGKIGGAQSFEGNDEINVADTATFDWAANDSFTIELWMKSDVPPPANENDVMIGRKGQLSSGSLDIWYVGVAYTTGKITYGLGNRDGNLQYGEGSSVVTGGDWNHIAYVVTGDNIKIYVNGVIDVDVARTHSNTEHIQGTPVTFGYLNYGDGFRYTGHLDEIAVYDGALSADQILQHAQVVQSPALTIISNPVTSAEVNVAYSYDVNSSNDPSTSVEFVLNISPSWMSIDTDSGLISGIPDTIGSIDVQVGAIDGAETATPQDYVLKIRNTSNLPDGMDHYWKLDETAGSPYLDSYLGADGTCTDPGCPDVNVTGPDEAMVGNAQVFNGSDEVDVADTATFDWAANDSFTIEFWMKSDVPPPANENDVMIGRKGQLSSGSLDIWYVGVAYTTGKITYGLGNRDGNLQYGEGSSVVTGGDWNHIAYVVTGDNIKIYVNGVIDVDVARTHSNTEHIQGTPVTFGYLNYGDGFRYTGHLDEIAVFDSALSITEIQDHYDNGSAGNGFETQPANTAPVADAGTPQSVETGTLTTLDGSASSDADGDPLTYSWSFTSKPGGSTATLTNVNTVSPTFTPDKDGDYVIQLIVNDGTEDSAPDSVTVTASKKPPANIAPVANAGSNQSVETGTITTLDGSASSDADGDPLTYSWSFTSKPGGSTATLTNPTTVSPTFTPDKAGDYEIQLIVNDGTVNSAPDSVTVTANTTPVADAGTAQSVETGTLTTLDGSASSDADGDPLTYSWSFTSVPAGSTATLTNVNTVSPTFTPDVDGDYVIQLSVNDGTVDSTPASVTVTASTTDTIPPVITLLGNTPIDVVQGSTYTDAGATALDDVDGDITGNIVTVNPVDANTLGQYTVTYNVSDAEENDATEVTRIVNVVASSWYAYKTDENGSTYTTTDGNSTVVLDSSLFNITVSDEKIIFEQKSESNIGGCVIKAYIELMSNGDVIAGYENSCGTDTTEYAPGATVIVGNDMVLLIEAEVPEDGIILEGE